MYFEPDGHLKILEIDFYMYLFFECIYFAIVFL